MIDPMAFGKCSLSLIVCTGVVLGCRGAREGRASQAAANRVDSTPAAPAPAAAATAPARYNARFETSAGTFVVEVHRDWAPLGADRFYELLQSGYYDDARFFRVIPGFMAQFGINGDPHVWALWSVRRLPDDPVHQSNTRGMVSFATAGPNTRTAQVFINYGNNSMLDGQGFAPFGQVVQGLDVVDRLYSGYGEGAPEGRGPDQERIWAEGNAYLKHDFPKLDYVKKATVVAQ